MTPQKYEFDRVVSDRPNTMVVTWEPSNKCNYACWYCADEWHNGSSPWPDADKAMAFFQYLAERNEHVYIDIIGGEPTQWPGLLKFISSLPANVDFEVTTNGSRTLKWWERAKPYLKHVAISYHPNDADSDHIMEVIRLIRDTATVGVCLMYDPAQRAKLIDMYERLVAEEITVMTRPLHIDGGIMAYSDEDLRLIREMNQYFTAPHERPRIKPGKVLINGVKTDAKSLALDNKASFGGWMCTGGTKRLHIKHDGRILAGTCESEKFGNINGEWTLPESAIVCKKATCFCTDDLRAEKWFPDQPQ